MPLPAITQHQFAPFRVKRPRRLRLLAQRFTMHETAERLSVRVQCDDGATQLTIRARRTNRLPASSVFASRKEAAEFFQAGALGYSAMPDPTRFQGLELHCRTWPLEPLEIEEAHSSYFDDPGRFPPVSLQLDSAFLMRNVAHEWHGRADLCYPASRREPVLA